MSLHFFIANKFNSFVFNVDYNPFFRYFMSFVNPILTNG
jgi:hypothetical protein